MFEIFNLERDSMKRHIFLCLSILLMLGASAQAASKEYQLSEGAANFSLPKWAEKGYNLSFLYKDNLKNKQYIKKLNLINSDIDQTVLELDTQKVITRPLSSLGYTSNDVYIATSAAAGKELCWGNKCSSINNMGINNFVVLDGRAVAFVHPKLDGWYVSVFYIGQIGQPDLTKVDMKSIKICDVDKGAALLGAVANSQAYLRFNLVVAVGKVVGNDTVEDSIVLPEVQVDGGSINLPPLKPSLSFYAGTLLDYHVDLVGNNLNIIWEEITPQVPFSTYHSTRACQYDLSQAKPQCLHVRFQTNGNTGPNIVKVRTSNNLFVFTDQSRNLKIVDITGKVIFQKTGPITDFDLGEGEHLIFQRNGYIYYQNILNNKISFLSLRLADVEKALLKVVSAY